MTLRIGKKCGLFKDVNDAGTLCGSVKDLDHVIDFYGTSAPTNIAAILENGKVVKLPYGDLDMKKIKQHEDGTFAAALSNDGNVVVGYCNVLISLSAILASGLGGANNEWKMEQLPLPESYNTVLLSMCRLTDALLWDWQ